MKTHLTYQEQIGLLQSRGLTYESLDRFLEALKNIGYYRFSGYLHPFRETDESLIPGATFEEVIALYNLDHSLRVIWRDALDVLETSLAAQIGYRLGLRSPLGHHEVEHLDTEVCESIEDQQGVSKSAHDHWLSRYGSLRAKAKLEDYARHHKENYQNMFPIWVATEFLDFGALVRLYKMLKPEDRIAIATHFGVAHDMPGHFGKWLEALNVVRNVVSHNGRVWNRAHVKFPPKPVRDLVGPELEHIRALPEASRSKTYPLLAITGYMMNRISPRSSWCLKVRGLVLQFEGQPSLDYLELLGVPDGWQELSLWR